MNVLEAIPGTTGSSIGAIIFNCTRGAGRVRKVEYDVAETHRKTQRGHYSLLTAG